jgi:hypothetical protein
MSSWTLNKPGYTSGLTASGGTGGYTWSATGMPAGLTMQPNGSVTGSPTTATTYNPQVTITDSAGNTLTQTFNNVTITAAPTIASVTLKNKTGGVAGTMEAGDTIVIQFASASTIHESTFCSSWNNDAADPTLSVTGNLVNVADGTGSAHDSITVFAPVANCASGFRFDSIDLGSNAYISGGAVTFGTSGTKTTFGWNHTTKTLTITLGAKGGAGTVANVPTSTATYTVSPLITDIVGGAISNGPVFTPPGSPKQQF